MVLVKLRLRQGQTNDENFYRLLFKLYSSNFTERIETVVWLFVVFPFFSITHQAGTWCSLSDETKKIHRDRYRDFFSRPRPRLFSRPNIFETDTETFFRDQMFLRPIPRLFFETKCFRDRYRDFFET